MSQKLPSRLHHNAYVVKDLEKTRQFYEDLIGLPLQATWCEKTELFGKERVYAHCFFGLADGDFTIQKNSGNGVSVRFDTDDFSHFWFLDFAAADGALLTPGTYSGAMRFPFQDPGRPGLSVYGDGRGCNTITGSFQVKQLVFGAGSEVGLPPGADGVLP